MSAKKQSIKNQQKKEEVDSKIYDRVLENIEKRKAVESKSERDKVFILWSGVIFFMLLILFFWYLNFKNNLEKTERGQNNVNWTQVGSDFNTTMDSMKQIFGGYDPINNGGQQNLNQGQINELKNELNKIKVDGISTSTDDELDEE